MRGGSAPRAPRHQPLAPVKDASGLRPSRSPLGGRAAPQTPCK